MALLSENYARHYHERLQELGFTWTLDDVLKEARRLTQPGQRPADVVSGKLNEWLIADGFKKS